MPEETLQQAKIILENAKREAKTTIEIAEEAAKLLIEKTRKETGQMIVDSIKTAFGQGEEEQKIVRLNRIPYICEDIKSIKSDQKKIIWGALSMVGLYILGKILKIL